MSDTHDTDWVPETVDDSHWSRSKEWQEYKAKQAALEAQLPASKSTLPAHMQVGTINAEKRKMTTHEIQMESCKVEWVDPNPPAEDELTPADIIQAGAKSHQDFTDAVLDDIAKTILERISKATDAEPEENASTR
jgi:hypothetical protein